MGSRIIFHREKPHADKVPETAATIAARIRWAASMPQQCMVCGCVPTFCNPIQTDHIVSGHGRRADHVANWLRLDRRCHDRKHATDGERIALATLVAAKYLCDREHFDGSLLAGWLGHDLPAEWHWIVTLVEGNRAYVPAF